MQKLSSVKLLLLIAILTVWGCHKDSPKPAPVTGTPGIEEDCYDYVYTGGEVIEATTNTGAQYLYPFFNPLNGDEFVYLKTNGGYELIKHTISTAQETVLCSSLYIVSQPQWGAQGWIIFSTLDQTIWKIRDDGTQLTQITANGLEYHSPVFNSNGTKFIHFGTCFPPYLGVFNLDGIIVDSLKFQNAGISFGRFGSFDENFENGYSLYANDLQTYVFGFCKLTANESVEILNSFSFLDGEPTAACKNSQYIYYVQQMNGLFRLNIATHQVDKLMDNCQSKYIRSLSMSPDGQRLLFERVRGHQTVPGGGMIDEQSEIFLYDVNTGLETKVLWEE